MCIFSWWILHVVIWFLGLKDWCAFKCHSFIDILLWGRYRYSPDELQSDADFGQSALQDSGPVYLSALRSAWLHFTQLLPAGHCVIFNDKSENHEVKIKVTHPASQVTRDFQPTKNCTCWCGTCHYDAECNSRSASSAKMWNHRVPHGVVFYGTKYLERTIHCMPACHVDEVTKCLTHMKSLNLWLTDWSLCECGGTGEFVCG